MLIESTSPKKQKQVQARSGSGSLLQEFSRSGLVSKYARHLNSVSPEDLRRLFSSMPDSSNMISLIQRSGLEGFTFHSIVIWKEERPILFLPLFETGFSLTTFLDGTSQKIMTAIGTMMPGLFCPRVLGVGFVEGEWSEIGFDPEIDRETFAKAWDLALDAFYSLAQSLRCDILAFKDFTTQTGHVIPMNRLKGFTQIASLPYGQLSLFFQNTEDYLAQLSKGARKDLRRKMRHAKEVDIVRTKNPRPWMDKIYELYRKKAEYGDLSFGIHHRDYFLNVCEEVPGAEFVLYFSEGKLAAFNLILVSSECLVDKYFGMDLQLGRKHNLYFLSWMENIRFGIEHGIPLYHAGQSDEKTKAHLGAQFVPSSILFKHRNPVIHFLLTLFRKALSYEPQVTLPATHLGLYWDNQKPVETITLTRT